MIGKSDAHDKHRIATRYLDELERLWGIPREQGKMHLRLLAVGSAKRTMDDQRSHDK